MNELFWKIYLKYTFKDILIFLKNLISLIVYDIYICIYIYFYYKSENKSDYFEQFL